MPSMFNRRSRSVSTSRPGPTTSNSAHAAAAQAFLASRDSQSNLSASAAAAALRSMSPTPTPVSQVQTKRMLNKSPSNSSLASAPRGRSRGGLQRTPSGGSMTERTFRSPSVGNIDTPTPTAGRNFAPPVPSIPTTYTVEAVPPIPKKSHRRSSSMELPPTRVLSPPPTRSVGGGQKVVQSTASSAATLAARRSAAPSPGAELERTDSRNSINFSYPRGSRPNSPPPSSPVTRASPASGISVAEAARIQNTLTQTAATPVKKKKNIVEHNAAEGSHFHAGSVASSKTSGSPPQNIQDELIQSASRPTKKAVVTGEGSHFSDGQSGDSVGNPSVTNRPVEDRRTQRASGSLGKQPSVVREDWEGERDGNGASLLSTATTTPRQGATSAKSSPALAQNTSPAANVSRKTGNATPSPRPSTYDSVTTTTGKTANNGLTAGDSTTRLSSVSPSRSTRFSDRLSSDLSAGKKHSPLPRSISPAKSALKHHSPARAEPSPTEGRFPRQRNSSVTPSEASDTSTDGFRKKSARVSFEASPEVRRTVLSNAICAEGADNEDAAAEGLKPRPALPAFGSVRKTKPKDASGSSSAPHYISREAAATGSSSSSDTSSVREPSTMDTSVSSDHALGGLLAREFRKMHAAPLPPQVTSVEGTGYVSDSDSDSDEGTRGSAAQHQSSQQDQAGSTDDYVPFIAVQPATPGLEEENVERFADEAEHDSISHSVHDQTTSGPGIADDEPPHALGGAVDPIEIKTLNTIAEEDTDAESIYSDAAEELDGDGFGSINAIVGSPIPVSPSNRLSSAAETPVPSSIGRPDSTRVASWEGTQLRWSEIAQQFRDSAQQAKQNEATAPSDGTMTPEQRPTPRDTRTLEPAAEIKTISAPSKKVQPVSAVPVSANGQRSAPRSSPSAAQGLTNSEPASTRAAQNKSSGGFRSSMRSQPEPIGASIEVPRMRAPSATQSNATLQRNNPATNSPTPMRRTFSNDSDSDSSFKRARRARKPADAKFTMKRSMRGEPATPAATPSAIASNRKEVRSMSPADRRPLSPIGVQKMRMSMRGSQDAGPPTLRSQPERKRSSSLFSLGRRAKSPTRPASIITPTAKSKSRIVDSDDERGGSRPTVFKSRFNDSSDDEDYEALRPVRGIPKRDTGRDSTDLDDSSDDNRHRNKAAPGKLAISIPPPSQPLSPGPMSPTTAKKLGIWGRLRGKKEDRKSYFEGSPSARSDGKVARSNNEGLSKDDKQLGFNSANERDLLIEQTRLKLEAARAGPTTPTGKLQRRATPQRILSDSWPLPPKIPAGEEDRPFTSDGVGKSTRPDLGGRQPTSETVLTAGGSPVYGRSGKKKRFPLLRRAFGLHD